MKQEAFGKMGRNLSQGPAGGRAGYPMIAVSLFLQGAHTLCSFDVIREGCCTRLSLGKTRRQVENRLSALLVAVGAVQWMRSLYQEGCPLFSPYPPLHSEGWLFSLAVSDGCAGRRGDFFPAW